MPHVRYDERVAKILQEKKREEEGTLVFDE